MAVDRAGKTDVRQRRMFQLLGAGQAITFGGGLVFDEDTGEVSILIDPVTGNLITVSAAGLKAVGPLTTKGDIWVWGTTNARLPVGANNTFLRADSAQTLGVRWSGIALDDLSDVTVAGATDGQCLRFDAGTGLWYNADFNLKDMSDFDYSFPSPGDVIITSFSDITRFQNFPLFNADQRIYPSLLPGGLLLYFHERFI